MSIRVAVAAFVHRSVSRTAALSLVAYSLAVALLLLGAAWWFCGHATSPPGGDGGCFESPCNYHPLAWRTLELADLLAVLVLGLGLFVVAPAMVAAAVAAERRAGTLDQLRTTPLSPLGLALGLGLGAPARLYLFLLGPLLLHVVCFGGGAIGLDTLITSLVVLAVGGLASLALGLAAALAPRQDGGGALVALAIAGGLALCGFLAMIFVTERGATQWAFLSPAGGLHAAMMQHDGLWRRLFVSPWRLERFDEAAQIGSLTMAPLAASLFALAIAGLVGAAACRQLAAPQLPMFAKRHAVALFTVVAAAVVVPLLGVLSEERYHDFGTYGLVAALALLPVAVTLGLLSTPSAEVWALAVRRRRAVSAWSDDAAPHRTMWIMTAILVALLVAVAPRGCSLSAQALIGIGWAGWTALWLPTLVLFFATRYPLTATRWACGAALIVHLVVQLMAIGMVVNRVDASALWFVQAASLAGLLVPLWVALRQAVLRRHTRDG